MKKLFLLLSITTVLFTSSISIVKADIGPKPTVYVKIIFKDDKGLKDSDWNVIMNPCKEEKNMENFYDENPNEYLCGQGKDDFIWSSCDNTAKTCEYTYMVPDTFRMQFTNENSNIFSNVVTEKKQDSYYTLTIYNDRSELKNDRFRGANIDDFLIAAVITIIVEMTIVFILFFKEQKRKKILLIAVFLSNLISLPTLWFFLGPVLSSVFNYVYAFIIYESIVILFETIVIFSISRKNIDFSFVDALKLSLVINIASIVIGFLQNVLTLLNLQ